MNQSYSTGRLSPAVRAVGELHLEGNVTPHAWYQCPRLRTNAGAPNLVAIVLLAELLYWHRPVVEHDSATGTVTSARNKFRGERYQANYEALARRFGLTRRQVQDNVSFLVRRGVVRREIVDKVEVGPRNWAYNVVFLTLEPEVMREMCALPTPSYEPTACYPLTLGREGVTEVADGREAPPQVNAPPLTFESGTPSRSNVSPPPDQTCAIKESENPRKTPNEISTTADARYETAPGRSAPVVVESTQGVAEADSPVAVGDEEVLSRMRRYTTEGTARAWLKRWGGERCARQVAAFEGHLSDYAVRGQSVRNPAGLLRQAIAEDWGPSQTAQRAAKERASAAHIAGRRADEEARDRAIAAQRQEAEERRRVLLASMEPEMQARLEAAAWVRAWRDAEAPPVRNRIAVAAKSHEKVGSAVRSLLKLAKSALLDEIGAEGEAALNRYEATTTAFMPNQQQKKVRSHLLYRPNRCA